MSSNKLSRRGNIAFVYLIVCVLCSLIMAFVLNVGVVTHEKLKMQNAADSSSIAASTWISRGLNAITATNHVMGEMAAMIVVHHALGGNKLDKNEVAEETKDIDRRLTAAAIAAKAAGANTPAFETVREKDGVRAGMTLLDSKIELKEMLTKVYLSKVAAKIMQQSSIPPVVAAGKALEVAMDILEQVILKEYEFLNAVHAVARSLVPMKQTIRYELLPAARDYCDHVAERYPKLAKRAAKMVGEKLGVHIDLFPMELSLPIEKDPHRYAFTPVKRKTVKPRRPTPPNPSVRATNMREQVVKTTQLVRAAFPWVVYHRQPVLDVLGAMAPLSHAKEHYKDWTDGTSKRLLGKMQLPRQGDLGLYVLVGSTPPDKGYELWTEDRRLLDRHFSIQAYASRKPPTVIGKGTFFKQEHPVARVAISQALTYNGNRQRRNAFKTNLKYKRILPERQADVGWDTLNWLEETRPYELVATTRKGSVRSEFPRIRVNWQAKLVPVSPHRVEVAKRRLPAPVVKVIGKMNTQAKILFTH